MASATRQLGSHSIKAGVDVQRLVLDEFFQFAVTDEDAAEDAGFSDHALSFDPSNPFVFTGRSAPILWSAFAQADWHVRSRVTVSGGVRFDQSRLLLRRRQISPRVGVSFRVTDATALRLSASRFFQPPQPENVLLSSSTEARELSPFADDGGGADLEPERQWSFEAGVDQQLGALLRFDGAFWYRSISEVADPNVFAGTTIIFPNAVHRGAATGADMRLEVARRGAWSGYGNLSIGRVRQRGPITGGLFLEDEIAELGSGEEFIPDHDQPVIVSAGVAWAPVRPRVSVSLSVRHESGTPIERDEDAGEELAGRPGAELVDFAEGRVKARTLASLQATMPLFTRGRRSLELQALVTEHLRSALRLQLRQSLERHAFRRAANPFASRRDWRSDLTRLSFGCARHGRIIRGGGPPMAEQKNDQKCAHPTATALCPPERNTAASTARRRRRSSCIATACHPSVGRRVDRVSQPVKP